MQYNKFIILPVFIVAIFFVAVTQGDGTDNVIPVIPPNGTVKDVIKTQKKKNETNQLLNPNGTQTLPENPSAGSANPDETVGPYGQTLGTANDVMIIKGKDDRIKRLKMVGVIGKEGKPLIAVLDYEGSKVYSSSESPLFGGWKVKKVYEQFIDLINEDGSYLTIGLTTSTGEIKESSFDPKRKIVIKKPKEEEGKTNGESN